MMYAAGLLALSTGLAIIASPASAQLQPWEDYEASDSVSIWILVR
jgi:hypothetical protein